MRQLGTAFGAEGQAGLVVVLSGERYGKAKAKLDRIEAELGRKLLVVEDGSQEVSRLFGVCEENDVETACSLPAIRVCGDDSRQLLALHGAQEDLVAKIQAVLPAVECHVLASPRFVDLSLNGASDAGYLTFAEMVDDPLFIHLHVYNDAVVECTAVSHLPTRFGVEKRFR